MLVSRMVFFLKLDAPTVQTFDAILDGDVLQRPPWYWSPRRLNVCLRVHALSRSASSPVENLCRLYNIRNVETKLARHIPKLVLDQSRWLQTNR